MFISELNTFVFNQLLLLLLKETVMMSRHCIMHHYARAASTVFDSVGWPCIQSCLTDSATLHLVVPEALVLTHTMDPRPAFIPLFFGGGTVCSADAFGCQRLSSFISSCSFHRCSHRPVVGMWFPLRAIHHCKVCPPSWLLPPYGLMALCEGALCLSRAGIGRFPVIKWEQRRSGEWTRTLFRAKECSTHCSTSALRQPLPWHSASQSLDNIRILFHPFHMFMLPIIMFNSHLKSAVVILFMTV